MKKTIKRIAKATIQTSKTATRFTIVAGVPCSLFWFATSSDAAFKACMPIALIVGLVSFNAKAKEAH